jgi:hypothetical protein
MDRDGKGVPVQLAGSKCCVVGPGHSHDGPGCFAGDLKIYGRFESTGRWLVENNYGHLRAADGWELRWSALPGQRTPGVLAS